MAYSVVWRSESQQIGRTPFTSKEKAVAHACANFPVQQRNYGVTDVEVMDTLNTVVFRLGKATRQSLRRAG